MGFALEAMLAFINKIDGIGRQDTLLMYLQCVTRTCLRTVAEKEQNLSRPPLNLHAIPFYPQNTGFQKDHTIKDQIL